MAVQSVCAVVVTYNPEPTFVDNIVAIASQVDHIVVVDNGSSVRLEQQFQHLESRSRAKIVRNQQNLGIAAALNIGAMYAVEIGVDWISTFDQDSTVCDGFFSTMIETYQRNPQPERVALVAPVYVDRRTGAEIRLRQANNGEILSTMTSGSMIPKHTFNKLGFFDERLFIDAVDKEYCLRARREGMIIVQSSAVLLHSLGRTTYHALLGLHFGATNHSAARRYYMARNCVQLITRYRADWSWAWREGQWMICDIAKIALVEGDKWQKFRAMMLGVADAISGRMGKRIEL